MINTNVIIGKLKHIMSRPAPMCTILSSLGVTQILVPHGFALPT